jgi:two-component system, OmpR family, response regulator
MRPPGTAAAVSRRYRVTWLKQARFSVGTTSDGQNGFGLSLTEPYDAAVIHIMLPKLDGLSLIQELRRRENNLPVLTLSAKRLLTIGSKGFKRLRRLFDQAICVPELLASVQALIRRASLPIVTPP